MTNINTSNHPIDSSIKPRTFNTGIIPCQEIKKMLQEGDIKSSSELADDQIQPASIDLRLGHFAYPVNTSFLSGSNMEVLQKLKQLDSHFDDFKIDLKNGAVLEKGKVYVIPLLEEVNLKSDVAGFANPKSSTGRLDILTRLITDNGTVFDQIERGYKGRLYVEVVPRTFSILVKTGSRLNQLRFSRTKADGPTPITKEEWQRLLDTQQIIETKDQDRTFSEQKGMLRFTVDLQGTGNGSPIGYRAKKHTGRIDLERRDYDPMDFWEPIILHKTPSLILDPDEFYILMTKESVAIPPNYAAEMVPYDTRAGEFRVHYAGFFDPGFGWNPLTNMAGSSRAVLEVRSHEVPFLLEHGQTVGWLRYERMVTTPEKLYGAGISSNYQGQRLKLAKQFRQ